MSEIDRTSRLMTFIMLIALIWGIVFGAVALIVDADIKQHLQPCSMSK